jgi:uncharacterized membrane protein
MAVRVRDRVGALQAWTWLWIAIGLGTATRLVLAFAVLKSNNDIASYRLVGHALERSPLHVYAIVGSVHWPYGPVYFPWIALSLVLSDHTGLAFSTLIKLPAIAADGALAWLVYAELLRSGLSARTALAAGCLIALGPTFVINSGVHGQIDSLATLPAVGALIVFRRAPAGRRAIIAGALAGLGTATKTPVGLILIPLIIACESPREALVLASAAVGVVAVLLAPFALATPHAVEHVVTFTDVAGVGGLPLVLVVDLHWSSAEHFLLAHRALITAVPLLGVAALIWRNRVVPLALSASLFWLAFYSVGTGFFFGYLVWGIPFFLLAGYLLATGILMAVVLAPTLQFETGHIGGHLTIYATLMTIAWALFVAVCLWQCWALLLRRQHPDVAPVSSARPAYPSAPVDRTRARS